jgi:hypothetical protein
MAGILQKGARRFTTQIGAAGVADAVTTTIPLVSVTGLPTDTQIELVIDRTDASGNLTPAKEEVVRGTVSGTSLINCIRGVEGTAQAHSAGATVNSFLTASMWNNIIEYTRDLPSRGLINGLIVPTVAGNNLTVAIKTLAGNDPSVNEPVYVWIGNTLRSITQATSTASVTAGTNWFNSGSAELATREIDYFVYAQWDNSQSKVNVGFSRIPYARISTDFVADNVSNGTNEKYFRTESAGLTLETTDIFVNIGRFAATLSAAAGHTWSVPTFTNANLIQEPIYETRRLSWLPTITTTPMTYTSLTYTSIEYQVVGRQCKISLRTDGTTGGTASNGFFYTMPFAGHNSQEIGQLSSPRVNDGGGSVSGFVGDTGTPNQLVIRRYDSGNFGLGANRTIMLTGSYFIN